MNKNIPTRIILDILIFLAVIHGWWFIALPLCILGVAIFGYFIEFIVAGFVYDAIYGIGTGRGVREYAGTIISVVILAIVAGLKNVMRK